MFDKLRALALLFTVLASGCAAPATPSAGSVAGGAANIAPPKRIVVAIRGDPNTLYLKITPRSTIPGISELQQLTNAGMAFVEDGDVARPQLAESLPSIEEGSWRMLPGGAMETTWR